jgi:signal transduction histidine kinase
MTERAIGGDGRATRRPPGSWIRSAVAVTGILGVGALLTVRIVTKAPGLPEQDRWLAAWLVVGLVDAVAGATLVNRLGHRRLAVCLIAVGAAALLLVVLATSADSADSIRSARLRQLSENGSWVQPLAVGALVALVPWELAPTDRRRRYETVWWATAALMVVIAVGTALGARSPGPDIVDAATALVAASATVATIRLAVIWWRIRCDGDDPLFGWLTAGSIVAWVAVVPESLDLAPNFPGDGVLGPALLIATLPLLVAGVIVRAMRERRGRFHGVARDVISWLVLSGAILLVYTAAVAGIGQFTGGAGRTWLLVATTALVAVTVEPARRRVQRQVSQLVWGQRDDPLEVIREVVGHVGADSAEELLPALAESLRRELRLDRVAIDALTDAGWQQAATAGADSTPHERVVELVQHGEPIGRLMIGWEDGPGLRSRDESLLADLAGPLALALGWMRITDELRQSSIAVVTAREEERRRLRRDLHDGLGPALTGVSLGVRAAMRKLERNAGASSVADSRELLSRTADQVDALVVEVKRIVRDLRPTALDQLGLIGAIAAFARRFEDDVDFDLAMPDAPIQLPAAVEVAVYRIVTEAVNNVVRHAQASHCWLNLSVGDKVDLDVIDDGVGIADGAATGVGWAAMGERVVELGGRLQVVRRVPSGTKVSVQIPVGAP